eukprot:2473321-Alexandrium_andersonii.AAC.1
MAARAPLPQGPGAQDVGGPDPDLLCPERHYPRAAELRRGCRIGCCMGMTGVWQTRNGVQWGYGG